MKILFRDAGRADVAAIVGLLREDRLGAARETLAMAAYLAAFDAMAADDNNVILVGEIDGRIVATCQITFIRGLSLRAAMRANVESVRVSASHRGMGIGRAMFEEVEARSLERGCNLIQLTMNASRTDAARFYESLGFEASHTGWKRDIGTDIGG